MENVRQNILNCFKDLKFDEPTHAYTVANKRLQYSVSGLVDKFKIPFDKKKTAYFYALKHGLKQDDVLKMWETTGANACSKGTKVHLFGECYTFNRNLQPSSPEEVAIVKFFTDIPEHIIPCLTEVQMYHKDYMFAGTMDTLLFNTKTNKFIITDFKTNKDLFKNFAGQTLTGPFSGLLDNPYNKYQIQLSLYQILFEQTGLEVSHRKIIHLKENEYALYDAENYTDILKDQLKLIA